MIHLSGFLLKESFLKTPKRSAGASLILGILRIQGVVCRRKAGFFDLHCDRLGPFLCFLGEAIVPGGVAYCAVLGGAQIGKTVIDRVRWGEISRQSVTFGVGGLISRELFGASRCFTHGKATFWMGWQRFKL